MTMLNISDDVSINYLFRNLVKNNKFLNGLKITGGDSAYLPNVLKGTLVIIEYQIPTH